MLPNKLFCAVIVVDFAIPPKIDAVVVDDAALAPNEPDPNKPLLALKHRK